MFEILTFFGYTLGVFTAGMWCREFLNGGKK